MLEQTISGYGECADDGVERLIRDQRLPHQHDGPRSTPQRQNSSQTSTPVTWKTPFEVDAPRDSVLSKSFSRRPISPTLSTVSGPLLDPRLSEEQDAWAGIDALLETRSLDDSFTFSTSDILPSSTVKAMRKDGSFRSIDVSVMNDDDMSEISDGLAVLTLKNQRNVAKKLSKFETGMPSLVEASDQDEDSDSRAAAENSGLHNGSAVLNGAGAGTLFDVFHWSEKDNVDETKGRKKKLNQTRKVQLSIDRSSQRSSNCESDTASLPSLNSFRDDELSTRSEMSDWHSMHDKGSVVTEDFRTMQKEAHRSRLHHSKNPPAMDSPELDEEVIDPFNTATQSSFTSQVPSHCLVFDKQVDEHIRRIQAQLPTISEDHSPSKVGRKGSIIAFLGMDNSSPSPNSVVPDESPFDDLPSLASFAAPSASINPAVVPVRRRSDRKEDKREPKPSLSSQLMSSIKRIGGKTSSMNGGGIVGAIVGSNKAGNRAPLVNGDEEKYFPETVKQDKSRLFSANRCLLNSGGDGVNWDAD